MTGLVHFFCQGSSAFGAAWPGSSPRLCEIFDRACPGFSRRLHRCFRVLLQGFYGFCPVFLRRLVQVFSTELGKLFLQGFSGLSWLLQVYLPGLVQVLPGACPCFCRGMSRFFASAGPGFCPGLAWFSPGLFQRSSRDSPAFSQGLCRFS